MSTTNDVIIAQTRKAIAIACMEARNEAIEEAAQLCEQRRRTFLKSDYPRLGGEMVVKASAEEAFMCANEIRRLKGSP